MNWSVLVGRLLRGGLWTTLSLYLAVLAVLFWGVFVPGQTLFSNDGPLGQLMAQCHALPARFLGCWADLNSVGFNNGSASPGITFSLQWLLGPVLFSKFYALLALWLLSAGAWCFFRELRLTPMACVLGGLAVMLSSNFFSVACWGVAADDIAIGMTFLALAAVVRSSSGHYWLRLILAGFAVGMSVVEGADLGAVFSMLVAAFLLYQTWVSEGSQLKNTVLGLGRLALIVVCAAFIAAQSIDGLVGHAIEGVHGTAQDTETKAQHWSWATQWSLPKREILSLIVPGLFGYRMDTPNGGNYWGMMGRDAAWDKYLAGGSQGTPPTGFIRYTGGGNYIGVLVGLVALWTISESFRRRASVFSPENRKWVWFWLGVSILSLLLALGHYAPFYKFFYMLPYASTIRNPTKFLSFFSFGLGVLFAYGIDGLERRYMQPAGATGSGRWPGFSVLGRAAAPFERYWSYAYVLIIAISLLGWLVYSGYRNGLIDYLQTVGISRLADADADFSIRQVGWFILLLALAAGLMTLIFSGAFAGRRSLWGGCVLGLLLVTDLGLANRAWIIYWNYPDKYASNPVIDILRDKPYEHRVVLAPLQFNPDQMILSKLYKIEWMQHQFPYYNIQSFDVANLSRTPEDLFAFQKMINQSGPTNMLLRYIRAYELTNTRYVIGPGNLDLFWNADKLLAQIPINVVGHFEIARKPGVAVATNPDQLTIYTADEGHFGLFEFPMALPRAKLFSHWQVNPNKSALLNQMFSPEFDPQTCVLVSGDVPTNPETGPDNAGSSTVGFVSYAPKDLLLKADAAEASVLLLNDHFDPDWKVFVDGNVEKLLHCNYLMRGVYLLPGTHMVEFKFLPPVGLLYVSLAADGSALLSLGALIFLTYKSRPARPAATPAPQVTKTESKPPKASQKPARIRSKAGKHIK